MICFLWSSTCLSNEKRKKMVCGKCGSKYGNIMTCPLDGHINSWMKHPEAVKIIKQKSAKGLVTYTRLLAKINAESKRRNYDDKHEVHCRFCGSCTVNAQTCPLNPNAKNVDKELHFTTHNRRMLVH